MMIALLLMLVSHPPPARYDFSELAEATREIPAKMPDLFPSKPDRWAAFLPEASDDHKRFAWLNAYVHTAVTRVGYERSKHGKTMDPNRILTNGAALCSQVAHVLVATARKLGFKARRLGIYKIAAIKHPTLTHSNHAMAEIYYDDAWHLFDPTSGAYYTHDGSVMSYAQIQSASKVRRWCPSATVRVVLPAHLYAISPGFPDGQLVSPRVFRVGRMKIDG